MKPMTALRCVWALAGVLLAGSARADGGEEVLAEASTGAGVLLDNAATKTALDSETLVLPAAWGGAATDIALTVRVAAGSVSSEPSLDPLDPSAEAYDWGTAPLLPGTYTLTMTAGGETYTATYEVAATAVAEWGTLTIDNGTTGESGATHLADGTESLVLPGAWGETVEGEITLTVSDGFGGSSDISLDNEPNAEAFDWDTLPLLPGTYDVTLKWNGSSYTTTYEVTATAEATLIGDAGVSLDNAKDTDGVRREAGWSKTFTLQWPGLAGDVTLTCNGQAKEATPIADGTWTWNTDGLVRGIYTFVHTIDEKTETETAKFYLDSDLLGVRFGDDAVLPVPADWYTANVSDTIPDTPEAVSDNLKKMAENGYPYWQNYVLGWSPTDKTAALLAEIVSVGGSGTVSVRVTGNKSTQTTFGDLTLKYILRKTDSEVSAFTQVGVAQDSPIFTDTAFATDAQQRYYRPAAVLKKK